MNQARADLTFSKNFWHAKLKGAFMLFRILAVLVWAFNATLVSNADAALEGVSIKWSVFIFVLVISALLQGYPTHIVNEIYDWQSGADRALEVSRTNPAASKNVAGGSKVIAAGLLTIPELWRLFYLTAGVLVALAFLFAMLASWQLLWFFFPGLLLSLFYSLPPFRFAYRPFLGEFLGGFASIAILVAAGYFAQSGALPTQAIVLSVSLGFMYIAIMVFFHYIDHKNDRAANPPKRTTVVHLGLAGSRIYACVGAGIGTLLMSYLAFRHHAHYGVLVLQGLVILFCHWQTQPDDGKSLVYWGKIMTYFVLFAGLVFATLSEPRFAFMAPVYLLGFWAHKRFGKLRPAPLAVASTA
jgi:1,4-dihydroxy-2-naphthoate octaprenyltransferase